MTYFHLYIRLIQVPLKNVTMSVTQMKDVVGLAIILNRQSVTSSRTVQFEMRVVTPVLAAVFCAMLKQVNCFNKCNRIKSNSNKGI